MDKQLLIKFLNLTKDKGYNENNAMQLLNDFYYSLNDSGIKDDLNNFLKKPNKDELMTWRERLIKTYYDLPKFENDIILKVVNKNKLLLKDFKKKIKPVAKGVRDLSITGAFYYVQTRSDEIAFKAFTKSGSSLATAFNPDVENIIPEPVLPTEPELIQPNTIPEPVLPDLPSIPVFDSVPKPELIEMPKEPDYYKLPEIQSIELPENLPGIMYEDDEFNNMSLAEFKEKNIIQPTISSGLAYFYKKPTQQDLINNNAPEGITPADYEPHKYNVYTGGSTSSDYTTHDINYEEVTIWVRKDYVDDFNNANETNEEFLYQNIKDEHNSFVLLKNNYTTNNTLKIQSNIFYRQINYDNAQLKANYEYDNRFIIEDNNQKMIDYQNQLSTLEENYISQCDEVNKQREELLDAYEKNVLSEQERVNNLNQQAIDLYKKMLEKYKGEIDSRDDLINHLHNKQAFWSGAIGSGYMLTMIPLIKKLNNHKSTKFLAKMLALNNIRMASGRSIQSLINWDEVPINLHKILKAIIGNEVNYSEIAHYLKIPQGTVTSLDMVLMIIIIIATIKAVTSENLDKESLKLFAASKDIRVDEPDYKKLRKLQLMSEAKDEKDLIKSLTSAFKKFNLHKKRLKDINDDKLDDYTKSMINIIKNTNYFLNDEEYFYLLRQVTNLKNNEESIELKKRGYYELRLNTALNSLREQKSLLTDKIKTNELTSNENDLIKQINELTNYLKNRNKQEINWVGIKEDKSVIKSIKTRLNKLNHQLRTEQKSYKLTINQLKIELKSISNKIKELTSLSIRINSYYDAFLMAYQYNNYGITLNELENSKNNFNNSLKQIYNELNNETNNFKPISLIGFIGVLRFYYNVEGFTRKPGIWAKRFAKFVVYQSNEFSDSFSINPFKIKFKLKKYYNKWINALEGVNKLDNSMMLLREGVSEDLSNLFEQMNKDKIISLNALNKAKEILKTIA